MRTEVKEFIEKNIDLIETTEFKEFYTKVSADIFGDNVKGQVTQVLWDADIHPEDKLIDIPRSFAHSCNDISVVGRRYKHVKTFNFCSFEYSDVMYVDLKESDCLVIGPLAFSSCQKLKTVTLPSSLQKIGYSAFAYCPNLESINIPSKIRNLEDTFTNCKSLSNVRFEGTKQQFEAIEKSNLWRRGSGIKEISCSDGILRFK